MASSQPSVRELYNTVVDEVIVGVRDCFLDEGIDEDVLEELKQLWKSKLKNSSAFAPPNPAPAMPPSPVLKKIQTANGNNAMGKLVPDAHMAQSSSNQSSGAKHGAGTQPQVLGPKKLAVQFTIPAERGVAGSKTRSFTIVIPASALSGNKLRHVLTEPVIQAAKRLPEPLAAIFLQNYINSAFTAQENVFDDHEGRSRGAAPFTLDGALDSSDDEDSSGGEGSEIVVWDDSDSEESGEEPAKEEEQRDEDGGVEDEPLNSDDDVSDEDEGIDDIIVCQYDKITYSHSQWQLYLKDGIMNIAGKEYVFRNASGDVVW